MGFLGRFRGKKKKKEVKKEEVKKEEKTEVLISQEKKEKCRECGKRDATGEDGLCGSCRFTAVLDTMGEKK